MPSLPTLLAEFERFIRRDPAGRGLIAAEPRFGPLCPGHLAKAAKSLAETATGVALVTGFYVPHAEIPAAETDGPLGTALLAAALDGIGIPSLIVTDGWCAAAVRAAAEAMDFPAHRVGVLSHDPCTELRELAAAAGQHEISHLIAVERVGPGHTAASIARQLERLTWPKLPASAPMDQEPKLAASAALKSVTTNEMIEHFRAAVPESAWDRCHNMRGDAIDAHTAPLHALFEEFPHRVSIGVGDGGNEIGMGSIPWDELRRRLTGEHAPRIPCRVRTDWTLVAGVSNWGAQALAAAVAVLRDRVDVLQPWDCRQQEAMLDQVLRNGPAVDGLTRRREPTVDGLPFVTYIQPWAGIRRLLRLPE
jgi:D-glutamate cyclase